MMDQFGTANQIQDHILEAVAALIIYRSTAREYRDPFYFIVQHAIRNGRYCEGYPLTEEKLYEIYRLLRPEDDPVEFIPDRIIVYNQKKRVIVWWSPASVKNILFAKNTKIRSGDAPVPATLFAAVQDRLYVWSLRVNRRPSPETMLYYSPYYNVSSGLTCTGNMRTPPFKGIQTARQWEELFFNSEFTLDHSPNLKNTTGKILWRSLIRKKRKRFPLEHLKEYTSLHNFLEALNGGG